MKEVFKKGFKMLATHLISLALTIFFMMAFGWVIEKWGFYLFSIITLLSYIGLFYSDAWNWGRREGRSYSEIKPTLARPLIASAIPSVMPLALVILTISNIQIYFIPSIVIAKAWYLPFIGLFKNQESITPIEILLSGAVIPIVSLLGYFIGTKNFSVLEKIAYRKRKKR